MEKGRVTNALRGIRRFAKFERILAAACILSPASLIVFGDGPIRDSISAYYNMEKGQFYYFPLTVTAMLFIVNGVVKQQHVYNTILGGALAGAVLFNHSDAKLIHGAFASIFFVGNAVVIVLFSSKKERWFKIFLVVGIGLSMIGCFFFKWFTLFWAEWLSFSIIALHYILESWGVID